MSGGGQGDGRVAVGVVVYRPDPAILRRLLDAVGDGERRVVVFANGPLAPDVVQLIGGTPNLRLLASETNVGLAAGLNAVVRFVGEEGGDHVVLFDQDSEPPSDLPERLLGHWRALHAQGGAPAAIGPSLMAPGGEGFRSIRYDYRTADDPAGDPSLAAVEFLPTSGSLIGLDAFRAVGPFRDDFFIDGIDVEWGLRARARGRPSYVARDIVMPHRWGEPADADASRQIARLPPLRTYYYVRNAVAVMALPHTPRRWRVKIAARLAGQAAYLIWHGGRSTTLQAFARGAAHGLTGRLGPAASGQALDSAAADAATADAK